MRNDIIIFENQDVKLDVNIKDDTVWLTTDQMSQLFSTTKRNVELHIKNIYDEEELEEDSTWKNFFEVQKEGKREVKRNKKLYNLDVIISVGYRVKSKNDIIFRKWANKILKEYLLKGYVVNQKRLEYLEKTVKLIDIANRIDDELDGNKRIRATLFIYFLQFYNILYKNNKQVIDNDTLVALTLLIAQSNPKEKDLIIDLVMNFLLS
ncbi:MAG: virulence RhuM family protein [Bacilli bacterium]|nr:virulence RhuM family protein [Bacilli bacterium]